MTSNFNSNEDVRQHNTREMDSLLLSRFELLSAYLDGEATAAECQQVNEWLATDAQVQNLYAKLIKLRQEMQALPVPPAQQPAQQMADGVFARIERQRFRRVFAWGGASVAALFIGAISVFMPGSQSPAPQLVKSTPQQVGAEPLMVALNAPPIEIPKAAVAPTEKSLDSR